MSPASESRALTMSEADISILAGLTDQELEAILLENYRLFLEEYDITYYPTNTGSKEDEFRDLIKQIRSDLKNTEFKIFHYIECIISDCRTRR
ncbi:hypothetical protein [Methylobacterium variabile]|uniref:hypothetical protein n=1 Tax=Methylobacterium variabile TaxID=298794 RepID=UPI000B1356BD|nr:hypothetical protein [Methylobacterium variabile]